MKIFIYALKNPDTNEIRYVGKTKNLLKKRLYEHCTKRNLLSKTHKNFWIKSLLELNKKPVIELLEICSSNNWKEREIFWITQFNNLTNTTLGGEGALGFRQHPDSIRKSIESRRKNNTLKRSESCKKRISESNKIYFSKKSKEEITKKIEHMVKILRKPILQFDLNNKFINEWIGLRECAKELNLNHCGISRCLNNKQKSYKGFIWKFK